MEMKAYKKNTSKIIIYSILSLFIVIGLTFYLYLKMSVPQMDGTKTLPSLLKKVEIYRDQAGIPHIYAQNNIDAFYSLGYLMASERLFQMEISRRVANGELAEIVGEKGLQSDKMFRSLKLRKSMQEMLLNKKIDSKMQSEYEAFYAGVNYFQETHLSPIEFKILNITPRPFSILDAYSFVGFMSFNFAIALSQDPLFSHLEKRLGPELVDDMRVEKINSPKKNLMTLEKSNFDHTDIPELISFLERGFPLFEGSNGWLLSKKRMENNENLLANDPHIAYPHPGIWFEAHLHTPEFETYGHFLPLIPFPILSHNKNKAWGLTMTLTDDMDLYKEELIGMDKYKFKGQLLPLKKSHEIIKVKGNKDYEFELSETHHGPILSQVLKEPDLAIKWAFHDSNNDPISTLFQMTEANSMAEFKAAVATGVAPGLNILYADKDNIAWWMFGKISLKADAARTDFILDGSSGKDEPTGDLKFEDKPHLENPENGVIVSANSRPAHFPLNQRGDWQPDDRFNTITNLLSKKEKWNISEIKEIQTLSLNLDNKLIMEQLLIDLEGIKENAEFVHILKDWNFISDVKSAGATLFFTFFNKIGKNLLKDLSPEELETFSKISTSYIFNKRVILDRKSIWWKKVDRKKLITQSFDETIQYLKSKFGADSTKWEWGKIHTIEFSHPLSKVPLLKYIFNLGPYPLSGSTQDINNQKSSSFLEKFEVKAGPSTRRIISFANLEEAYGILPIGESGHLLSPYYKNQINDFINLNYRPMILNKDTIVKNHAHLLVLLPVK
jgi:penicillin amidase